MPKAKAKQARKTQKPAAAAAKAATGRATYDQPEALLQRIHRAAAAELQLQPRPGRKLAPVSLPDLNELEARLIQERESYELTLARIFNLSKSDQDRARDRQARERLMAAEQRTQQLRAKVQATRVRIRKPKAPAATVAELVKTAGSA